MESIKFNKLENINRKETDSEQTSGYPVKGGKEEGQYRVRDEEVHTIVYKISYKDVLYNMGNTWIITFKNCESLYCTYCTSHGTTDWFKIGKGVCQGYILSSCLFNFYAEYII